MTFSFRTNSSTRMGKPSLRLTVILITAMVLVFSTFLTLSTFRQTATASDSIRIMPLGDSITTGVGSSARGGYRIALWNESKAAGWHLTFVGSQRDGPASFSEPENEGHPGWRIDQLSSRIVTWLEISQPQIVLLHIGTNDIIQNHDVRTAPARLAYLIEQITTTLPRTTVIVAQITPLGRPGLNAEIVNYDKAIPPIVKEMDARGKHVIFVDMYDAVPLKDLTDSIHPDDEGYTFMAHVWFTALRAIILPHRS